MTILIAGGAGYIGSHVVLALLSSRNFRKTKFVIMDNLSMGHLEIVKVLQDCAVDLGQPEVVFEKADLLDSAALDLLFERHKPDVVLHLAAKISVAESVTHPALYFSNNVTGSQNLLLAMKNHDCKKIVFSSTASVYGNIDQAMPIVESQALMPANPYAESKLNIEQEIEKASVSWGLKAVIFRFFNASGASARADLGEWHEPETHLIPLILESAIHGKTLHVYGSDYPTRDGTCIRDYIHVDDLASAHELGVIRLLKTVPDRPATEIFNLGTEHGTSVLEVIHSVEKICGLKVSVSSAARRDGDTAVLVASNAKAREVLGWKPMLSDMDTIVKTAYDWQKTMNKSHQ